VIGATNEVPEDEVGEAFFDRFLVRVPVVPVSAAGFGALLGTRCADEWSPPDAHWRWATKISAPSRRLRTTSRCRHAWSACWPNCAPNWRVTAVRVRPPLGEDRVAAARGGGQRRPRAIGLWDLLLLPACIGSDAERQAALADWLHARLGVREAFAPARLSRVVQAFEAQLETEQKANDLDYDELGRLRFSQAEGATGMAERQHRRRQGRVGCATHELQPSPSLRSGAHRSPHCADRRPAGAHRDLRR
jgi:MoxR-like ATPase